MNLDLRIPMGLMFTLVGIILAAFGLATRSNAALYERSLGINNRVRELSGFGVGGSQRLQLVGVFAPGQFAGALGHCDCLRTISELRVRVGRENPREAVEGIRQVLPKQQGAGELAHRLTGFVQVSQRDGKPIMNIWVRRGSSHRFREKVSRFIPLLLISQALGQVELRFGVAGPEAQRFLKLCDTFSRAALLQ